MRWTILAFVLVSACEFADVDTGESGARPPDLVGTYASSLRSIDGCEDQLSFESFDGPLVIGGVPSALTFQWDGFEVTGTTDASFAVTVDGVSGLDAASVTIDADGLATLDAGGAWVLDLGVTFDATFPADTGASPCSASGTLEAQQQSAR
ncbi:MAG: hypothetical protein KC912_17170 [Proteobacteria bacterium]|nr:hypothetical protein [Pseudomonadota bacterium]